MALRTIAGLKYNDHTEPTFKKLEILPFPNLIEFFNLQFMQQFVQKFLPDYMDYKLDQEGRPKPDFS